MSRASFNTLQQCSFGHTCHRQRMRASGSALMAEPRQVSAAMTRGELWCRYNPYVQARGRVDQLRRLGHSVDKVEFILMGGTFMSLPADYRDFFVRGLHDALSGHSSADVHEAVRL